MLCAATVALNAAERRRRQPLIGRAAAVRSAKRRYWEPACLGDKDLSLAPKGKTPLIQFEIWSCCLGLVYALRCHCCTECARAPTRPACDLARARPTPHKKNFARAWPTPGTKSLARAWMTPGAKGSSKQILKRRQYANSVSLTAFNANPPLQN